LPLLDAMVGVGAGDAVDIGVGVIAGLAVGVVRMTCRDGDVVGVSVDIERSCALVSCVMLCVPGAWQAVAKNSKEKHNRNTPALL
jgi:hypothetical protein